MALSVGPEETVDALVMCGGRGTRLDSPVEKPLFRVNGRPMVDHVLGALDASSIDTVYAVVSSHTPDTREAVAERSVPMIEAAGNGYVEDLGEALDAVNRPVLTVTADLPLLEGALINRLLAVYERTCSAQTANGNCDSLSVAVPTRIKELLGVSADRSFTHEGQDVTPAGINIVGDEQDDTIYISHDVRLAVNVNRLGDAQVAEELR